MFAAPCPVSGQAPLDTILLAQQKLLQPTYPSKQQHSALPHSRCTAIQPPGGQTVAKSSREQSTGMCYELSPHRRRVRLPSTFDFYPMPWTRFTESGVTRSTCWPHPVIPGTESISNGHSNKMPGTSQLMKDNNRQIIPLH